MASKPPFEMREEPIWHYPRSDTDSPDFADAYPDASPDDMFFDAGDELDHGVAVAASAALVTSTTSVRDSKKKAANIPPHASGGNLKAAAVCSYPTAVVRNDHGIRPARPMPPAPIDDGIPEAPWPLPASVCTAAAPKRPTWSAVAAAASPAPRPPQRRDTPPPPLPADPLANARALNRARIMERVSAARQFISERVHITSRVTVRELADMFSLRGTFASAATPRECVTALRIVVETMVRRASGVSGYYLQSHLDALRPRLPRTGRNFAVHVLTPKGMHACACGAHGFLAQCTDDESREIAAVLTAFATYLFETLQPPPLAVRACSPAHAAEVLRALDECAALEGWLREILAMTANDLSLIVFDDTKDFDRLAELASKKIFTRQSRHLEHICQLRAQNSHHSHLMEEDAAAWLRKLCRETKNSIEMRKKNNSI